MKALAPVLALLAAPLAAQPAPPPAFVPLPTLLTLTAEGRVTRTPDQAELSAGVVTNAATAADALAGNSRAMTAMVAALRKAGVAAADLQTSNLSLNPQYRYENNRAPVLTGYQAANTVRVKVRNLAGTGALVDAMVAAGANQINGPSFSLSRPEAALDEAREAAIKAARARADLYARAAGMKVVRIQSIVEGGAVPPEPMPMLRMAAMAESAPPPPVEAGAVDMTVSLNVSFELE